MKSISEGPLLSSPTLMRVKQPSLKKVLLFGQAIQRAGTVKGVVQISMLNQTGWKWKTTWYLHYHFCYAVSLR